MNRKSVLNYLILLFSFPVSHSFAAEFFTSEQGSLPIVRANRAYLAGDFGAMAKELKQALETHPADDIMKTNVEALLARAYEAAGSAGIPSDWHLPKEVISLKVAVRRVDREVPKYSIKIEGNTQHVGAIKQLRLVRFPNEVILDKLEGKGVWDEQKPVYPDDLPFFGLDSLRTRDPIPHGLYFITLDLVQGGHTDGWFILTQDMNSTASPVVVTPLEGETLKTANPIAKWEDFKSPQYKPFEHRRIWTAVSRSEPPQYDWDLKWQLYQHSPELQEVVVGRTPGGRGVSELESGRYEISVNYRERRSFGELILERQSSTVRPFRVQN